MMKYVSLLLSCYDKLISKLNISIDIACILFSLKNALYYCVYTSTLL